MSSDSHELILISHEGKVKSRQRVVQKKCPLPQHPNGSIRITASLVSIVVLYLGSVLACGKLFVWLPLVCIYTNTLMDHDGLMLFLIHCRRLLPPVVWYQLDESQDNKLFLPIPYFPSDIASHHVHHVLTTITTTAIIIFSCLFHSHTAINTIESKKHIYYST